MIKNFAVEAIKTLTPSEMEELRLFLQSPYHSRGNNKAVLVQLFETVAESIQLGTLEQLDKAKIFAILYPDKPVLENKIDKLFTELKGLLQTFLIVNGNQFQDNSAQLQLSLLHELRIRGLDPYFSLAHEKMNRFLKDPYWETVEGYLFRHQVAFVGHEWELSYNKAKGDLSIPQVIHELENYYFTLKTELLNRLLLQSASTQLPEVSKSVIKKPWTVPGEYLQQNPMMKISWEIFLLFSVDAPEPEGFYRLLKKIQEEESNLSSDTLAQYYAYLRNVCALLIDSGNSAFFPVLHEIHKDNLKRGYHYYLGKISSSAYLNITQVALRVREYAWAWAFVHQHKDMIIEENDTRDFFRMNVALCLFAEKKYAEALEMIPFGSSYTFYHLVARKTELKIYYELKSDLLEFKIDAYAMFISRTGQKALGKGYVELYLNFINIVRQLNNSFGKRDPARSEQLIHRIQKKKRIAERDWLLEKAREIGAGKP